MNVFFSSCVFTFTVHLVNGKREKLICNKYCCSTDKLLSKMPCICSDGGLQLTQLR